MSKEKHHVLIIGGSGSIGLACANELAKKGYNLILIYRDSRSVQKKNEIEFNSIRSLGIDLITININANTDEAYVELDKLLKQNNITKIKAFIHAYADANIGGVLNQENELLPEDFQYTFNSMALSFVMWSKWLVKNNYLKSQSRILGFTSEGSFKVLHNYAAVGIAKAALETACRYMAIEFAKFNINVNLINSGIIFSKSVEIMEKQKAFVEQAKKRNPFGRLTEPKDVAKVVAFLISDDSSWITGQTITVDGGEQLLNI